jgi:ubiquinone/menaquinone biosynthesis C-methylase UbiE
MGEGTRTLTLEDIRPHCDIVDSPAYRIEQIVQTGDLVADIGCGYGPLRPIVERIGATWIGIEPFPVSADVVKAPAENLPFPANYFDVIIMNAVLEHIPDVCGAFMEVRRTLKPGGQFIGYSAFMECFHEISYHHLSHKAIEFLANQNGLVLERIAPGKSFGIDYHCARLLEPFIRFNSWPMRSVFRPLMQCLVRIQLRILGSKRYWKNRIQRKMSASESSKESELYRKVETLRYASGFTFVIRKPNCIAE